MKKGGPSIYPSSESQRAEDDGISKFNTYLKFNFNKESAIVAQFNQLKAKFDQFNRDDSSPRRITDRLRFLITVKICFQILARRLNQESPQRRFRENMCYLKLARQAMR